MQIECNIRRDGGSRVTIDNREYLFTPRADGRHVAEVKRPDHISALLKISSYQVPPPEGADPDADSEEDDEPLMLSEPGEGDREPVLVPPEDDEGEEDAGEGEGGEALEEDEDTDFESMEHADLIEAHTRILGRAPHPNAKEETIRARLIEARDQFGS